MNKPNYLSYFTQGTSPYLNWDFLKNVDLSWVDKINEERALEKQKRIQKDIEENRASGTYVSSDEDIASKDFNDIDFPGIHEWPVSFTAKYKNTITINEKKLAEIIKSANEIFKFEEFTLYVDCEDSNHYFSTPFYGNGTIEIADQGDNNFDSTDTAVYAFINDHNEWEKTHGKAYKSAKISSNLEALSLQPFINETEGCQHSDLASFGYAHGATVECPFCGKMAEVW